MCTKSLPGQWLTSDEQRDAVSGSNRNIVFDVSGYIVLKSAVSLSSSITINGQTAPSPGIGIMAGEVSASDQSNIIIRSV